jgi:hypothetical protein
MTDIPAGGLCVAVGIAEVRSWGRRGAGRPPGRAPFLEPTLGVRQDTDAPHGEPPDPAAAHCLDVGAPVLAARLAYRRGTLPGGSPRAACTSRSKW